MINRIAFALIALFVFSNGIAQAADGDWKVENSRDDKSRPSIGAASKLSHGYALMLVCTPSKELGLIYQSGALTLPQKHQSLADIRIEIGPTSTHSLSSIVVRQQSEYLFATVLSSDPKVQALIDALTSVPGPIAITVDGESKTFPAANRLVALAEVVKACKSTVARSSLEVSDAAPPAVQNTPRSEPGKLCFPQVCIGDRLSALSNLDWLPLRSIMRGDPLDPHPDQIRDLSIALPGLSEEDYKVLLQHEQGHRQFLVDAESFPILTNIKAVCEPYKLVGVLVGKYSSTEIRFILHEENSKATFVAISIAQKYPSGFRISGVDQNFQKLSPDDFKELVHQFMSRNGLPPMSMTPVGGGSEEFIAGSSIKIAGLPFGWKDKTRLIGAVYNADEGKAGISAGITNFREPQIEALERSVTSKLCPRTTRTIE